MQWIKAKNKLPQEEWYGPIRHRYDEKYKVWEYDACSSREMQNNIENYPDVEWLDESEPDTDTIDKLKNEVAALEAENKALIEEIQNWKDELKDQAREHRNNR